MVKRNTTKDFRFFVMTDQYVYENPIETAELVTGYHGWWNKLQMFDRYRDGQNIYFDLDVIIKGDCNHFLRKEFTLCHAWWRESFHTPLNSSIISWQGDVSHIHDKFIADPEYYMLKYNRGIDQFIYENIPYKTYTMEDKYCSYQTITEERKDYVVYLFNQRYQEMRKKDWYTKYYEN